MFTHRRVAFWRSAASAVMLSAMVWFAWTSRASAGPISISFFDPESGNIAPVVGPTFSTVPSGLTLTNPPPLSTPTSTGFTISNLDYTINNTTSGILPGGEGNSLDVQWKASRRFSVASSFSSTIALDASLLITTSKGPASGQLQLTALINTRPLIGPATTLFTLTAGPSGFATQSWQNSLPYSLDPGNYTLILQSDLLITSIASGASVTVDDTYGVDLAAPAPSSWLLFTVLGTTMLAGWAGQRWVGRRRCESAQCAASLGG